jgi:acyl dehydratase
VPGPHFDPGLAGSVLRSTGDVVSSAPELPRLALNIAAAHHDSRVGGRRLVYGAHTIGLALGQASRLLPNLVTVLGSESCDHTGPVHEGDILHCSSTARSQTTHANCVALPDQQSTTTAPTIR